MNAEVKIVADEIVMTAQELQYLKQFLAAGDRPGFYMAYYAMVGGADEKGPGWDEMALQAQISSFSGKVGAIAWFSNSLLKATYPTPYHLEIFELSQNVAESAASIIGDDRSAGTGYVDSPDIFRSAEAAWAAANVMQYFPGNLIRDLEDLSNFNVPDGEYWPLFGGLASVAANGVVDQAGALSALRNWLVSSAGATPGARAAFLATLFVVLTDQTGKKSDHFAGAGYQTIELADGHSKVVISTTDNSVVAVEGAGLTPLLTASELQLQSALPAMTAAIAVLADGLGLAASVLQNSMTSLLASLFEPYVTPWADLTEPPLAGHQNTYAPEATEGSDTLHGSNGLLGVGGSDTISAGGGHDVVFGGSGADMLDGGAGNDLLYGGDGRDLLVGGDGDDILRGGDGDDVLRPGAGDDVVIGGDRDKLSGQSGRDVVEYLDGSAPVALTIGQKAQQVLVSSDGQGGSDVLVDIDRVRLGDAGDVVTVGGAGATGHLVLRRDLDIELGAGENVVNLLSDGVARPDGKPSGYGINYRFSTALENGTKTAEGETQVITLGEGYSAQESNASWLWVDGRQLIGGATFDFDKFDLFGGRNSTLFDLPDLGEGTTVDRLAAWVQTAAAAMTAAMPGGLAGFVFGAIFFQDYIGAIQSWIDNYIQRTVGGYGENYQLSKIGENEDGDVYDLTITLRQTAANGEHHKVVVHGWQQGDLGIRIEDLGWRNGLDSGLNKNGERDSWSDMSLDWINAKLATLGLAVKDVLDDVSGGAASRTASATASIAEGRTKLGNAHDNVLVGDAASDLLRGGRGDDTLRGGGGKDVFVFAEGDGDDVIMAASPDGGVIRFLNGFDPGSVTKTLVPGADGGQDLLVGYGAQGDTIRIVGWSLLSAAERELWTFDGVEPGRSSNDPSDTPDLSSAPPAVGGTSQTTISGTASADTLNGTELGDLISGLNGDDRIDGGTGDDRLTGGSGLDTLLGGSGDDYVDGGSGRDLIVGGRGDDELRGGSDVDTYVFNRGDGADWIIDSDAAVEIFGPRLGNVLKLGVGIAPSDLRFEQLPETSGFTLFIGNDGDRIRVTGSFIDLDVFSSIVFANGVTWGSADIRAAYLRDASTIGDDYIQGFYGHNTVLVGGPGDDRLIGRSERDTFVWNRGDGNDTIVPYVTSGGDDFGGRLVLGPGINPEQVRIGDNDRFDDGLLIIIEGEGGGTIADFGTLDHIVFDNGTVWTRAYIDAVYLADQITNGADTVYGTERIDVIETGAGDDTIYGSDGRDVIDGGVGNDTIFGHLESTAKGDLYRFGDNFGRDVLFYNQLNGNRSNDRVEFTAYNLDDFKIDLAPADRFWDWGGSTVGNIVFERNGSSDRLLIDEYSGDEPAVGTFVFADGTVVTYGDVAQMAARSSGVAALIGSVSEDSIVGTTGGDVVFAGEGADFVQGDAGADLLYGGSGDDQLSGGGGADYLVGGSGDDRALGGADDDVLFGNEGDDHLSGEGGNDRLHGDRGDDILHGGAGADTLSGGAGSDTYRFNLGDGHDIIDAGPGRMSNEVETLILGGGITVEELTGTLIGNDLKIAFGGRPDDSITIKNYLGAGTLNALVVGGQTLNIPDLLEKVLGVTSGDDVRSAQSIGAGRMVAYGGRGNDTLTGSLDADTFVFAAGDGQDRIRDWAGANSILADDDELLFLGGIRPEHLLLVRSGVDLVVSILGTGDKITLERQFASDSTGGVESFRFEDGVVWSKSRIQNELLARQATAGEDVIVGFGASGLGSLTADVLAGGAGDDLLQGGAGNDTYRFSIGGGNDVITDTAGVDRLALGSGLTAKTVTVQRVGDDALLSFVSGDSVRLTSVFAATPGGIEEIVFGDGEVWTRADIARNRDDAAGSAGADVVVGTGLGDHLAGGAGDDRLEGGAGGDTYYLAPGDGQDVIVDTGTSGVDRIRFAPGVTPAQVGVSRRGDDLVLTFGAGDSVTIRNHFPSAKIEEVAFEGGLVWGKEDLAARLLPTLQTVGDDLVSGTAGADMIAGGAGNDTLEGGDGADTYMFNLGDGRDVIIDASDGVARDRLVLGSGIASGDVVLSRGVGANINDLVITIRNSTESITVKNHFSSAPAISQVWMSDGSIWTAQDIRNIVAGQAPPSAPVLGSTPLVMAIVEDADFDLDLPEDLFSGASIDGQYSLSATLASGQPLPTWLTFNAATGQFEGRPGEIDVGVVSVTIRATDQSGREAERQLYLVINGVNDAPTVGVGFEAQSIERDEPFSLTLSANAFRDSDSIGLTLSANLANGDPLPSWLTFNPATWTFSGVPGYSSVGQYEGERIHRVAVTATDSDGVSATQVLEIVVKGPHRGTIVEGTSGDDLLEGTLGPDRLIGGAGDDVLQGGHGPDSYVFDLGWGDDRITREFNSAGRWVRTEDDFIKFGEGIRPEDILVERRASGGGSSIFYEGDDASVIGGYYNSNLLLTHRLTGDTITVESHFDTSGIYNPAISGIVFANGVVWSAADVTAMFNRGSAANDLLVGDDFDNEMVGGDGDDKLLGEGGDDILNGGAGNDDLYGDVGNDIYYFGRGSGSDRIIDGFSSVLFSDHEDTLKFGEGISFDDLIFTYDNRDPYPFSAPLLAGSLTISIRGTTDTVTIYHQNYIDEDRSWGIDQFEFSDGQVLTRQEMEERLGLGGVLTGTNANETLVGTSAADRLEGRKGNDVLRGQSGNDTYVWGLGDGNDTIIETGISSFDILEFGSGVLPQDVSLSRPNHRTTLQLTIGSTGEAITVEQFFYVSTTNVVNAMPTLDEIRFADGTVWTAADLEAHFLASTSGDDEIFGFNRRMDRMDGGAGNDILHGMSHFDTYVFGRGYGVDRVVDSWDITEPWFGDIIEFNSSVNSNDVSVDRLETGEVVLMINGTSDKLILEGGGTSIDQVRFLGGGWSWNAEDLATRYAEAHSSSGSDTYIRQRETLIDTGSGDDRIVGRVSGAELRGGAGSDVYVIKPGGYGRDVIVDGGAGVDVLEITWDLVGSAQRFFKAVNGRDLILALDGIGGATRILIKDALVGNGAGVDQVKLADGTVLSLSSLIAQAIDLPTIAQPITGTAGAESLSGNGVFDGQGGDDVLRGQQWEDVYVFRTGSGNDTIIEGAGTGVDSIRLEGLTASDVVLARVGNDLVVTIGGSGETLTVRDQFVSEPSRGVEEIIFADGTVLERGGFLAPPPDPSGGTSGSDTLTGTSAGDSLDGLGGNDVLYGLDGDDQLTGGSGNDVLYGGGGVDTARFAVDSTDIRWVRQADGSVRAVHSVSGESDILWDLERAYFENDDTYVLVNDVVADFGTNGDDAWVEGTAGDDMVYGLAGDDTLAGRAGNDVLDGGAGDDQVNYSGAFTAFTFQRMADGAILVTDTVGQEGQDRLIDVEAVYFAGDQTWRSLSNLVGEYGTNGDDAWLEGTAGRDTLYGLAGDDTLVGRAGDDILDGGAGDDQANYTGASTAFTFQRMADGAILVTDTIGQEGQDRLIDVEAVYFAGNQAWRSLGNLVADYGTVGDDAWVSGTDGDDDIYALDGDDVLVGWDGDDRLFGGGGYDQANYYGSSSDYSIVRNPNGTVTITNLVTDEGVDVLDSVEALYFVGDQTWTTVEDALGVGTAHTSGGLSRTAQFGSSQQLWMTPAADFPDNYGLDSLTSIWSPLEKIMADYAFE